MIKPVSVTTNRSLHLFSDHKSVRWTEDLSLFVLEVNRIAVTNG